MKIPLTATVIVSALILALIMQYLYFTRENETQKASIDAQKTDSNEEEKSSAKKAEPYNWTTDPKWDPEVECAFIAEELKRIVYDRDVGLPVEGVYRHIESGIYDKKWVSYMKSWATRIYMAGLPGAKIYTGNEVYAEVVGQRCRF
jgi:hypothetical protein